MFEAPLCAGLLIDRVLGVVGSQRGPDAYQQELWHSLVLCLSHIVWQTQALVAGLGVGWTR